MVNGYPYAIAPSPYRNHQWFTSKFILKASNETDKINSTCECQVYSELDWVIDEDSVVRPDCMIVCGNFSEDFLTFPPALIVEISSPSTKLRDRNTKYNLYEMKCVKYYVISNTEAKTVDVFELVLGKYTPKTGIKFQFTDNCQIDLDVYAIWKSM